MAYSSVTLTGTYQLPDGTPAQGTIEIIPSERQIIDDAGDVILSGRVKVALDSAGSFSVALPATDDPALTPTGFGYTVSAKLHYTHLPAVSFSLPAAVPTVDITDVTSVDPSTFAPDETFYTAAETDAAIAAGGGGGGAVSSVNAQTGAVVLDAADVGAAATVHTHDDRYYTETEADALLAAKATTAALTAHTGDVANPHAVTKAQVGLASVDNTSDVAKPVSTAQAAADTAVQTAAATDATTKANAAQAYAIQRANHTGSQAISTVTGLQAAIDAKAATSHTHVATTDLTATGTKDATTFLRGDDTWAVPAGGGSSPDGPTPRAAGAFMVHPAGGATTTGIFGFIYLTPMVLPAAINIDQAGIELTTAQAATNTVTIGYYTQNAGGTLDLQATFGTVASDTTGVKIVSGTWTLPAGPIWLAFSATTNGGAFRAASTIAMPGPLWVTASAQIANAAHGLRAGAASGTLPNPLTPSVSGDVAMPRYVFRKA